MDYTILEKYAALVDSGADPEQNTAFMQLKNEGWVKNDVIGSKRCYHLDYVVPQKEEKAYEDILRAVAGPTVFDEGYYYGNNRPINSQLTVWDYYYKIADFEGKKIIYIPYKNVQSASVHQNNSYDSSEKSYRLEIIFIGGEIMSLNFKLDKKSEYLGDKEETDFLMDLIQKAQTSSQEERMGVLGDETDANKRRIMGIVVVIIGMIIAAAGVVGKILAFF